MPRRSGTGRPRDPACRGCSPGVGDGGAQRLGDEPGGKAEIEAAQAQRDQTGEQTHQRAARAADQEAEPRPDAVVERSQRRAVGARRDEAGVAEVGEPGVADHQVVDRPEQPEQQRRDEHRRDVRAVDPWRDQDQQAEQHRDLEHAGRRRGGDAARRGRRRREVHGRSPWAVNRPCGRNTSTRMMISGVSTLCQPADMKKIA